MKNITRKREKGREKRNRKENEDKEMKNRNEKEAAGWEREVRRRTKKEEKRGMEKKM